MIKINIEADKPEELVQFLDSLYTEKRAREKSDAAFKSYKKDKDMERMQHNIDELRGNVLGFEADNDRLKDILSYLHSEILTEEQIISEREYVKENMKVIPENLPF